MNAMRSKPWLLIVIGATILALAILIVTPVFLPDDCFGGRNGRTALRLMALENCVRWYVATEPQPLDESSWMEQLRPCVASSQIQNMELDGWGHRVAVRIRERTYCVYSLGPDGKDDRMACDDMARCFTINPTERNGNPANIDGGS
ncbi:MAG: hypothetical protein H6816_12380 [Phycisphaerales bacterium]|nr:hypothetical protein [Phycisphaerales bacterium]